MHTGLLSVCVQTAAVSQQIPKQSPQIPAVSWSRWKRSGPKHMTHNLASASPTSVFAALRCWYSCHCPDVQSTRNNSPYTLHFKLEGHRLQARGYRLQAGGYRLQARGFRNCTNFVPVSINWGGSFFAGVLTTRALLFGELPDESCLEKGFVESSWTSKIAKIMDPMHIGPLFWALLEVQVLGMDIDSRGCTIVCALQHTQRVQLESHFGIRSHKPYFVWL